MANIVNWKPSRLATVETILDDFLAAETAKMGQVRAVAPPPSSARLLTLPFVCSEVGKPFVVTVGQDRLGEPYHIKSLEKTYARFLTGAGYTLDNPARQAMRNGEIDWTGFQCWHCGAGRVKGFTYDWLHCPTHDICFCGNRVEMIHGGGTKARCPACKTWAMTGAERNDIPVSGVHFGASKGTPSVTQGSGGMLALFRGGTALTGDRSGGGR